MTARRFPPPWTVEDIGACFVVKDNSAQKLTYVYYEGEPGRRAATKLMTRDEAQPLAPVPIGLPIIGVGFENVGKGVGIGLAPGVLNEP